MEEKLKEQDEKLTTSNDKITELSRKVDALMTTLSERQPRPAVRPATPAPAHPPPTSQAAASQPDDGFQLVRQGARPTRRVIQPTKCVNRFQILEEEDEPESTYLVGDSIVRQQLSEFCGRVRQKRRLFCVPGAGVNDITNVIDQVSVEANEKTLFVIHTGSNDIKKLRSEELLNRYRKLIQQYKTKSRNIMLSGVLPRIDADNVFYSKAFSLNNRLQTLCKEQGIEYVNMWNDFYKQSGLFQKDGLHLSGVGAARYGRLLNEAVRGFWSKNGVETDATETVR